MIQDGSSEAAAFGARQIYGALYKQKIAHVQEITTLPAELRSRLNQEFSFGLPGVDRLTIHQDAVEVKDHRSVSPH